MFWNINSLILKSVYYVQGMGIRRMGYSECHPCITLNDMAECELDILSPECAF